MDITLEQLIEQCTRDSNRWFPGKAQKIENQVLCLAGEVGEVANLVKKVVRGSISVDEALEKGLAEEIVDCQVYLANLMGNPIFSHVDWVIKIQNVRENNEARFGNSTQFNEEFIGE
jgi:NTP pyrophosphatase (non-canonical NTP hydrolase)